MQVTLLSLVYLIAFTQATLLATALWNRTGKGQPSRILAVMMLVFAYKLFEGGVMFSNLYQFIPHALDWLPGAALILGPLFFGYIRQVFGSKPLTSAQWLLHMLPAIAIILYNSPTVFVSAQQKIHNIDAYHGFEGTIKLRYEIIALLIAIKIHLGIYLTRSWVLLRNYGDRVADIRADQSERVLSMHRYLCMSFFLLEAVWVVLFVLQQFTPFVALDYVSKLWLLFMSVIVLTMGYNGLRQPDLLLTRQESMLLKDEGSGRQKEAELPAKVLPLEPAAEPSKYGHSSLDAETATQIAELVNNYLKNEQGYLNDKLTLPLLSDAIGLKPHQVSQVINQHMNTSFYHLINHHRVAHAVGYLSDESLSWSLERIALESGFSNRVTFNNAFKNEQACTPSQYRKRAKLAG